mmetsp:Transcript_40897/g.101659  ORF Transcript_40897/g.101659 Transcript_40897/m.101659 type:complete len:214 (-) Transcript_40897:184-825(-)
MKKSSCYCRSGPGRLLDALSCFFRGVVMSEKWVEKLVSHAVAADPGPEYEVMPRISCTIFDNLYLNTLLRLSALSEFVQLLPLNTFTSARYLLIAVTCIHVTMDGLYPDDAHDARTSARQLRGRRVRTQPHAPKLQGPWVALQSFLCSVSPLTENFTCAMRGTVSFRRLFKYSRDTCSEYVIELSQTPGAESFDHAPAFLRAWAVLSILNLTT